MKVTIKIDTNECIAAANCTGVAPEFFQLGDQPYVELLDGKGHMQGTEYTTEASAEQVEMFEEAAESCPTRAITVIKAK
ncbi:MAG: ferredoxin [Acidobacteriaceae bacterium]|nr:ferredoxin [Acidobacteriaceae bacterium]